MNVSPVERIGVNPLLTVFLQRDQGSVDSQGQLHGQLWRDNRCDDEDTVQQQLSLGHASLQSSCPDIGARCDGEDEQEADEQEAFEVVGRDALGGENHRANKLALCRTETSAEDNRETASIWGCGRIGGCHGVFAACLDLQCLGTGEKNAVSIGAIHVESVRSLAKLYTFLQEWGRFAGEHSLVNDTCASKKEKVAGNSGVGLRTH